MGACTKKQFVFDVQKKNTESRCKLCTIFRNDFILDKTKAQVNDHSSRVEHIAEGLTTKEQKQSQKLTWLKASSSYHGGTIVLAQPPPRKWSGDYT